MTSGKHRRRKGDLAVDPELWLALNEGRTLSAILADFYTEVFDDPRLGPFFHKVTKEWAIGKQYSFLKELITGEKVYWGDRPRNAHHWMVISDELFDYREAMLERHARNHGLSDKTIERWRRIHEVFRRQIVKDAPIPKKIRGKTLPLEGYESLKLEVGTVCDGCMNAIEADSMVDYHVRTGETYCCVCSPASARPSS